MLSHLTPRKADVFVSSNIFKGIEKEQWYGVPYKVEEFSLLKIEAWSNAINPDGLAIPPKNEFIPANFDLLGEPLGEGERDEEGPTLIVEEKHFRYITSSIERFVDPKPESNSSLRLLRLLL